MPQLKNPLLLPTGALLVVTAVWGSTFFLIKDLVITVPALDFLGIRFVIAAAVVIAWRWKTLHQASRRTWLRGTALAAVYSSAQILQTVGLETTAASISGFLTGLYVVFTPLFGAALLHQRIGARVWAAAALATAGLAFLRLQGLAVGLGETLTVFGAVLYAFHVLFLSRWAPEEDPATLAFIQIVATGAILGLAALPGGVTFPQSPGAWASVLYMALVAGVLVLVLQTWAQSRLTATTSAVIMTTEPVFAASFAILLGGETLTWRIVGGGTLVLIAMLLVESKPASQTTDSSVRSKTESERGHPNG